MPAKAKLMDHVYISVQGKPLPTDAMDDLIEVNVESNLSLPDMFTIHLHDPKLKRIDTGPFELGKEVIISAMPEGEEGVSERLIRGEITALEPDFGEGTEATLLVRGYDHSHRLHRGTHSKAYLNVTDSDLVERIAGEVDLSVQADATTEVYDHVLQHNQSHMEFLSERARRIGYEFFVEDKTLYFRKPAKNGGPTIELEWGVELRNFRPRLSLIEQVNEVIVKGWDPKLRQTIIGSASAGQAEPEIGLAGSGSDLASQAFSSARRVVVDRDVSSQAEADTLAQAVLDELSGAFIEAGGVCYGQPKLRAGTSVKLKKLGQRFSGTYFVTAATHIYRADGAYQTAFEIHGRRPETLYALVEGAANGKDAWQGPVIGVVTNNKDPEDRGRVKVKYPWLSDKVESDWARIVGVGAGHERGFYCLPEVNDEVLVLFENDDASRPYVIGGLWNGQDQPPARIGEVLDNGKVRQRIFKTRAGHILTFTDGPQQGVVIETAGGLILALDDASKTVSIRSKTISIKSDGDLNLQGANLKIEATGSLTLKGQTFSLNATDMGEVKAGATLGVRGALVKIN
jgi:phage protein D/phage baseplate assembly protein gpV